MDTLSHALSGALLGRATGSPNTTLNLRDRTLVGFVAAAFPDLDYVLFWLAPLEFLNWHRGLTHSLLLLPLWALLIAISMSRLSHNRYPWRDCYIFCALGIGVHILGDVITIYGTKVLFPLSEKPLALNLIFDLDPYMAAIIGAGFVGAVLWHSGRATVVMIVLLAGYLMLQTVFNWRTTELGKTFAAEQGLENAQVYALPQPFSPVTWKLIVAQDERYWVAYLKYLTFKTTEVSDNAWLPWRLLGAYRPVQALQWREYRHFGKTEMTQTLAQEVWQQDRFAPFRRFAVLPALYRVDRNGSAVCIWFTDLRHNFPVLAPSFRYGMCRDAPDQAWRLYRLRYFRVNERQFLG